MLEQWYSRAVLPQMPLGAHGRAGTPHAVHVPWPRLTALVSSCLPDPHKGWNENEPSVSPAASLLLCGWREKEEIKKP